MKNKEVEKEHEEFQERFNKDLLEHGMPENNFKMVAVGYLDSSEEFEKGEVSGRFITKLNILWGEGVTLGSLGSHICEFCEREKRATSSSEKELVDRENNVRYFFPKMIFHYIEVHKFKPSNEFIEFVMNTH